jgi:molecular chaperone GrpE
MKNWVKKIYHSMSTDKDTTVQDEYLDANGVQTEEMPQNEAQSTDGQPVDSEVSAEKLQQELADLRDKYIRLMSDFDNYKKRTSRERIELIGTAAQDTLTALLPVLDDFDRAQNLTDEQKKTDAFQEGIQLVYHKLSNILQQRGLEPMESTGQDFNPDWHEALTEIPAPTEALKGKVVDTIERGYLLKGKIIRYAKVVTGK